MCLWKQWRMAQMLQLPHPCGGPGRTLGFWIYSGPATATVESTSGWKSISWYIFLSSVSVTAFQISKFKSLNKKAHTFLRCQITELLHSEENVSFQKEQAIKCSNLHSCYPIEVMDLWDSLGEIPVLKLYLIWRTLDHYFSLCKA